MKKNLSLILCFVLVLTSLIGCTTSKKPAPKPAPPTKMAPKTTPKTTPKPVPRTPTTKKPAPSAAHSLAKRLSDEAEKIDGVKSATVVVSDSTALVGLETDSTLEASKTKEVKDKVIKKLKEKDKSLKDVTVTTDPNLITRMKKVAKGVEEGRPLSEFTKEVEEITRRMSPKTK